MLLGLPFNYFTVQFTVVCAFDEAHEFKALAQLVEYFGLLASFWRPKPHRALEELALW